MSTATAVGLRGKRRRLIAVLALVVAGALAASMATVFTQSKSEAHGATVFPGSRQYFCYFDALAGDGALDPYNEACQAALDEAGSEPFYNWFGNLDSNGAGQTEGYIPDGRICDGGGNGPYDFRPFNDPGDWPKTHVTAGDTVEWRYNNWAHHPGEFDLYITKDGWNPNQPIAWDDLELFETIADPPQSGGPGTDDGYYYADLTLPDRSGYHVIFTHWIRSDSTENFYACSDVEFDGGNGEVSGVNPDAELPGQTTVTDRDEQPVQGACTAEGVAESTEDGTEVTVTVTNTDTEALADWMIHWMWGPDAGVTITDSWDAEITTMGDMQMAEPDGNGDVAPDESVEFGFTVDDELTLMPQFDCIPQ